jgi:hypothetical protein
MPLQPALIATRDGRAIPSAPLSNRVSPLNYWFSKWVIEGAGWQLTGGAVECGQRGLPRSLCWHGQQSRSRGLWSATLV